MGSGIHSAFDLQEQASVTPDGEKKKTKPMAERPVRQAGDRVSLRLSGKLVAIPWDDQKVLNIDPNSLAIAPPERSDRVQQEG